MTSNNAAMADTINAFAGDPALARALVARRQATHVVICRTANDFNHYRVARADGLAARLAAGRPPAWLEPVAMPAGTGLYAWRVKRGGS